MRPGKLIGIIPPRARRRLRKMLPPEGQEWARRVLVGPVGLAEPKPVGSRVHVRVGSRNIAATVMDDATPLIAYSRNLDLVTEALESAGIPYFCRPTETTASAVVVSAEHRVAVTQLLHQRMAGTGYADPVNIPRKLSGLTVDLVLPKSVASLHVYLPITNPTGTHVLGDDYSCVVEFWAPGQAGELIGPAPDSLGGIMPLDEPDVDVPAWQLNSHVPGTDDVRPRRSRAFYGWNTIDRVPFPIDAVFTWVDGGDPDWLARKQATMSGNRVELHQTAAHDSRYTSRDELRYALRSVVCNAPWIRQIFLVTDDQAPPWLDLGHPMVKVVSHREIFGDVGRLPTFNSHAIESRLHHIPGLAEHFLYFNDDLFLGRPLPPTMFFHPNGVASFFPSAAAVDPRPASPDDLPVNAAAKNNRRIIAERFGFTITRKMRHTPHALARSVLAEIEAALPEQVLGTAANQFRHPADLSIPSSLAHYWGFFTNRATPSVLKHMYAVVGRSDTPARLHTLLRTRKVDVFCLNDTDMHDADQTAMMSEFLSAYFPFRAPFELPDDVAARRAMQSATALLRGSGSIPAPRSAPDQIHPACR